MTVWPMHHLAEAKRSSFLALLEHLHPALKAAALILISSPPSPHLYFWSVVRLTPRSSLAVASRTREILTVATWVVLWFHCPLPVRIQLKAVLHFIIFMGISTRDNIFFVLFTTKRESFLSSLVTIQCRTGQSPASYKDGENEAGIKWGNNINCLISALLCLN